MDGIHADLKQTYKSEMEIAAARLPHCVSTLKFVNRLNRILEQPT
jgi:hypothetical protein